MRCAALFLCLLPTIAFAQGSCPSPGCPSPNYDNLTLGSPTGGSGLPPGSLNVKGGLYQNGVLYNLNGTPPAGATTQVQSNQSGSFYGDTGFTYSPGSGLVSTSQMVLGGATGGAEGAGTLNATGLFINGTAVSAGGTPGGSDTNIQINQAGVFGGDSTFTFNATTKIAGASALNLTGAATLGGIQNNAAIVFNLNGSTNTANQKVSMIYNIDPSLGDTDTTIPVEGFTTNLGSWISQAVTHHGVPLEVVTAIQNGGYIHGLSALNISANLRTVPTPIPAWAATTGYTAYLSAVLVNNANYTSQVFQATATGVSGSSFPTTCSPTCTDGTVTWQPSGPLYAMALDVGANIYGYFNQNQNGTAGASIGQTWGLIHGLIVGASGTYAAAGIGDELDLNISPIGPAAPSGVTGLGIFTQAPGQGSTQDAGLSIQGNSYAPGSSTFTITSITGTDMLVSPTTGIIKIGQIITASGVTSGTQIVGHGTTPNHWEVTPSQTVGSPVSATATATTFFASRRSAIVLGTTLDANSGVGMVVTDSRGFVQFGAGLIDCNLCGNFAGTSAWLGNDVPFLIRGPGNFFVGIDGSMRIGPATIKQTSSGITIDASLSLLTGTSSFSGGVGWPNGGAACDTYGNCGIVVQSSGVPTSITLTGAHAVTPYLPVTGTVTNVTWHQINLGGTNNGLSPTDQKIFGTPFTVSETYTQCGGTTCTITIGGNAVTNVINPGQSALRVHLSTPQTVMTGASTKVAYDTTDWDTGTYWVNGSGTTCSGGGGTCYNPKVSGKYRVCVHNVLIGTTASSASVEQTKIYKNGSVELASAGENVGTGSFTLTPDLCDDVVMNGSTDYIEGWAAVTCTGTCTVGGASGAQASVMTIDFIQP